MISWEVWLRDGKWGLYIRDYFAHGVKPDYTLFKAIDQETAVYLVTKHLAGDLYGGVGGILRAAGGTEESG